jgi:hypothetical protein
MAWFYGIFVVVAVAVLVWIIVWSYQHGGPKGAGRVRSEFEQARDFPFDRTGSSDGGGIDF